MGPRPDGRGKLRGGAAREPTIGVRQWGRGQTAAESVHVEQAAARQAVASMGPRPDGRGKAGGAQSPSARAGSVNGAAARRPRKGRPHPCIFRGSRRQWGRGQTAAESVRRARRRRAGWCVNGAAARRPRKGSGRSARRDRLPASMGPRPDGRGKREAREFLNARPGRQWGRGQTAAESRRPTSGFRSALRVNGAAARRPRKDC